MARKDRCSQMGTQGTDKAVLETIRESLAKGMLPEVRPEMPARPASFEHREDLEDRGQLRVTFAAELKALSAQVYSPAGRAEALEIVRQLIQTRGTKLALAWDAAYLPIPGVREVLTANGMEILDATLPDDEAARAARLTELERATVGVTGALAGLADTGSLVLLSGPGRGRLASLLPLVHIALLPANNLYPTMAAFFAAHAEVVRQASNLVFISGPSRTADIEQALTLGAHGPRELHVVIVDG